MLDYISATWTRRSGGACRPSKLSLGVISQVGTGTKARRNSLVTALFQVFDRSSKGSLSRVEMEILLRTSCQALTSLYRTKPVADYKAGRRQKNIRRQEERSGRRSGRASLADLLRWVRGGDEVQTFLSLFDRESLEGTLR